MAFYLPKEEGEGGELKQRKAKQSKERKKEHRKFGLVQIQLNKNYDLFSLH